MQGHSGWTGYSEEFWQNMIQWKRKWQTTPVFLPQEPHEQYEKAKRYGTGRWTPQVGRCPVCYWEEQRATMGLQRVRHDLLTEQQWLAVKLCKRFTVALASAIFFHLKKNTILMMIQCLELYYSSTFAWKIPWVEEPGRLQSMGSLELDATEQLHFHFSLSCIGGGSGNPLQCSCLENPRDGEAWDSIDGGLPSMGLHRVGHD